MSEFLNRVIYNSLANRPFTDSVLYSPTSSSPIITEGDYRNGSITRWFVRRFNEGPPMETSQDEWNRTPEQMWIKTSASWKISGQRDSTIQNGITTKGARQSNEEEIVKVQRKIPDIRTILSDPLQFWRP